MQKQHEETMLVLTMDEELLQLQVEPKSGRLADHLDGGEEDEEIESLDEDSEMLSCSSSIVELFKAPELKRQASDKVSDLNKVFGLEQITNCTLENLDLTKPQHQHQATTKSIYEEVGVAPPPKSIYEEVGVAPPPATKSIYEEVGVKPPPSSTKSRTTPRFESSKIVDKLLMPAPVVPHNKRASCPDRFGGDRESMILRELEAMEAAAMAMSERIYDTKDSDTLDTASMSSLNISNGSGSYNWANHLQVQKKTSTTDKKSKRRISSKSRGLGEIKKHHSSNSLGYLDINTKDDKKNKRRSSSSSCSRRLSNDTSSTKGSNSVKKEKRRSRSSTRLSMSNEASSDTTKERRRSRSGNRRLGNDSSTASNNTGGQQGEKRRSRSPNKPLRRVSSAPKLPSITHTTKGRNSSRLLDDGSNGSSTRGSSTRKPRSNSLNRRLKHTEAVDKSVWTLDSATSATSATSGESSNNNKRRSSSQKKTKRRNSSKDRLHASHHGRLVPDQQQQPAAPFRRTLSADGEVPEARRARRRTARRSQSHQEGGALEGLRGTTSN